MNKTYLFFVKYSKINSIIYLTFKIKLNKIESTTEDNIIAIVNDLLRNQGVDPFKFDKEVKEVKLNDKININELNNYLSRYIYFDEYISQWILVNKTEPDYNLFNILRNDLSIKLILIGKPSQKILENKNKRKDLFEIFERYYHKKPSDASIYANFDNGCIDIDSLLSVIPNDKNKYYCIILPYNTDISTIIKFYNQCKQRSNIDIFINNNNELYIVKAMKSEIKLKRVDTR